MKQSLLSLLFLGWIIPFFGQNLLSGTVTDKSNGEPLVGATIVVQGTDAGAYSDEAGKFSIESPKAAPFTIVANYFGYDSIVVNVTTLEKPLSVQMTVAKTVTDEVLITDTRITEKQKTAPLTVEALDVIAIKETPAANFYEALGHLKGVDLTSASLGFKVINTRGFNSTSPVRSLQIIDWVDNQSPGLNFSLGNFLGASDLDIQKVDVIVGASSAFYGPNAFNGVISMTTKDPFAMQGLSVSMKGAERSMAEFALRYAKAFHNKAGEDKFAFKVNLYGFSANDWNATNFDASPSSKVGVTNPGGYDAVNRYGDENLTSATEDMSNSIKKEYPGLGVFHRTGYKESDLVDYGTKNFKANTALHYRFYKDIEAIYSFNFGTGTTVYQGDNRYSFKGIKFYQNRIEIRKPDKFFIRAYSTQEDAGKSYDAVFTAFRLNDMAQNNTTWATDYRNFWQGVPNSPIKGVITKLNNLGAPQYTFIPNLQGPHPYYAALDSFLAMHQDSLTVWHSQARAYADSRGNGYFVPGTARFDSAFQSITSRKTTEGGTRFFDKSALYHVHGEYKFTPKWTENITVGGNGRLYTPNSEGTIFKDTAGMRFTNYEFGMYGGIEKKFIDKRLKVNVTMRVDKNQNFNFLASPAASLVYNASSKDVIRFSFASAIRNPTLADQYLYYNVGRAILIGNLNGYKNYYTVESIANWFNTLDTTKLVRMNIDPIRPEKVKTFELGYRTTLFNHVFVDASYYYSLYTDFIGYKLAVDAKYDKQYSTPVYLQAYRIAANAADKVSTQGFSLGFNYYFKTYYSLNGNYSWNRLDMRGSSDPLIPAFNTPENKFNIGLAARDIVLKVGKERYIKHWGASINFKWIQGFQFTGSPQFSGEVPSYYMLDAQINKIVPKIHTTFKLGASNLTNNQQYQVYGGPRIGRLAYLQVLVDLDRL